MTPASAQSYDAILARLDAMDAKLGTVTDWIGRHDEEHDRLEAWKSGHQTQSAIRDHSIKGLLDVQGGLDDEVAAFHDFRIEMRTYATMLRWATGGSIIAAIGGVASLVLILSHLVGGIH